MGAVTFGAKSPVEGLKMRRAPFLAASLLVAVAHVRMLRHPGRAAAVGHRCSPAGRGCCFQAEGDAGMAQPVPADIDCPPRAAFSPAIASQTRLRFEPIVGTSVDAATPCRSGWPSRARERGMRPCRQRRHHHHARAEGLFLGLTEGKQTTVIYVWDVYDPAGNRVHRISGQQKAASPGGEGWTACRTRRCASSPTHDRPACGVDYRQRRMTPAPATSSISGLTAVGAALAIAAQAR